MSPFNLAAVLAAADNDDDSVEEKTGSMLGIHVTESKQAR